MWYGLVCGLGCWLGCGLGCGHGLWSGTWACAAGSGGLWGGWRPGWTAGRPVCEAEGVVGAGGHGLVGSGRCTMAVRLGCGLLAGLWSWAMGMAVGVAYAGKA